MPSELKPDKIGFCRIHTDYWGAAERNQATSKTRTGMVPLFLSARGASASEGSMSKTVPLVPVCWVNCWRMTCHSTSVTHSSSCSLSCNHLVSCPRDLSTALVMFYSLTLCWQNSAPSRCSGVCSLRVLN